MRRREVRPIAIGRIMHGALSRMLTLAIVLPEEQVRTALRVDAPYVALAIIFVVLGLASVAVYRLRSRTRDAATLWFGIFALLFGIRQLLLASTVRFALGGPEVNWFYVAAAISYVIPLPGVAFVHLIFPPWRPVLVWVMRALAVWAPIGIVWDQVVGRPEALSGLNSALVLVGFAALIWALFRQSGAQASIRGLRVGALAFALAVVFRNLAGLHLFPSHPNLEPFGLALFLAALGRVVLIRMTAREEQLVAIKKELEVARRIQESILPQQLPRLPQMAIAARYRPMTAVAGDFYDFLRLDDRRLGILVADVSGHGVPAALIASMVKVAISAQLQHADDPGRVLSGMNRTLAGQLDGQFVTAAYLFVDLEAGHMRYGAAGHPPLLWWRGADRVVEPLVENGLVLGLMPQTLYTFTERPVTASDRFLLYTDGLVEATDRGGEQFGEARLQALLQAGAHLNADQLATSALEQLGRWVGYSDGRTQEDDLTVLVVDL